MLLVLVPVYWHNDVLFNAWNLSCMAPSFHCVWDSRFLQGAPLLVVPPVWLTFCTLEVVALHKPYVCVGWVGGWVGGC